LKYTTIGLSRRKVSQISLGTWQYSSGWGYGKEYTKVDAIKIVHQAIDSDINLIDSAEAYGSGESERVIGEAIKGYEREDIIISTKFLPMALRSSAVERALKKSLNRLQTSYIDIYLIHWPNPLREVSFLRKMEDFVDDGLIRNIGVSNFSQTRLKKAQSKMKKHKIQVNQVNYSLVKNKPETKLIPYVEKEQIKIMAYSPLAQGWLTGKYTLETRSPKGVRRRNRVFRKQNMKRGTFLLNTLKEIAENYQVSVSQVALNWIIRNPVVIAIPGAKSIEQVQSNIAAADFELSAQDVSRIKEAQKNFHPKLFF
jgi:aryl-alcohol dehydrogenase-like predicted oxidoreductase